MKHASAHYSELLLPVRSSLSSHAGRSLLGTGRTTNLSLRTLRSGSQARLVSSASSSAAVLNSLDFLKKVRDTPTSNLQPSSSFSASKPRTTTANAADTEPRPFDDWLKRLTQQSVSKGASGTTKILNVQKNFYEEHEEVKSMTEEEVQQLRQELGIKIIGAKPDEIPRPARTFAQTGLPSYLTDLLKKHGMSAPTPVQCQSIPLALSGRDIIARAETGSGKTLSFLLPACVHIRGQEPLRMGDGPIGLVLAPTRELAQQIYMESEKFGYKDKHRRLSSLAVYGGVGKGRHISALHRGVEFLVATPGRLIDLCSTGAAKLDRVSFLVLDEADTMLDMGFEPQIREILQMTPTGKQLMMYSATWPRAVDSLAREFLNNPVQINIGSLDLTANPNVTQIVDVVESSQKPQKLKHILEHLSQNGATPRILIFAGTKTGCESLSFMLRNSGIQAAAIHGDKSQLERDQALFAFKNGKLPVLVATDVASRGLDIKDVAFVINYDFPNNNEAYVHRIGRTGRAGAKGVAYSFFSQTHSKQAAGLVKILEASNQEVPQALKDMTRQSSHYDSLVGSSRFGSGKTSRGGYGGGRGGYGGGRGGYGGGRGGYGGGGDRPMHRRVNHNAY
ncbi:putative ATP-dependent RNA helicase ddx17 [Balamuthia mandrillaris]